ncbi:phosphate transport system permease protein [uncultured Gammaproteobacteria bacterium]
MTDLTMDQFGDQLGDQLATADDGDETAGAGANTASARSVAYYRGPVFQRRLRHRYLVERWFRWAGLGAIGLAITMLVVLLGSIVLNGWSAFRETKLLLEVSFDPAVIERVDPGAADYAKLARMAVQARFPEVTERSERRQLNAMLSDGAGQLLRAMVLGDPALIGQKRSVWVPARSDIDQLVKGNIARGGAEGERRFSDRQLGWVDGLRAAGALRLEFNTTLFFAGDSREPELAGILSGLTGSLLTLIATLLLAMPVGVAAAVYLEEFATHSRWTDLIEVNINNLAAVPSIIFGLLGLSVFLNLFGLPRSAALAGGMVLALMTLPTIIIASRSALKAVPPSIREAALGVGASPVQTVFHHVLPLAMPGILTGMIIGMSRALGETAPLLMIGMVAFVVDIPRGFTDSTTVLPVQIYMWAASPERAFTERTSAAILILLVVLTAMNALAVYLRRSFEKRW